METSITDPTTHQSEDILGATFELKEEIQSLCEKLATYGEESLFISTNKIEDTSSCRGSTIGLDFIFKKLDIIDQFYHYCRGINFNRENSKNIESDELETAIQKSVHTFNYMSSISASINDHRSPSGTSISKDLLASCVKTEDLYETPDEYDNMPNYIDTAALKRGKISAVSKSDSKNRYVEAESGVDNFRSNDSSISLDMSMTSGEEDTSETALKVNGNDTNVIGTNISMIKVEKSDMEFKDIHVKVKDNVIKATHIGKDLVKRMDTKTDLPSSEKKSPVKLVSLLTKRKFTSDRSDLKDKHVVLKTVDPQEKKVLKLDITKGAKMYVIPVKKKDLQENTVGYSSTKTQVDTLMPASNLIIKTEPIHMSKTQKFQNSEKGKGFTLIRNPISKRAKINEESNKQQIQKIDEHAKAQKSSSESEITSSLSKNIPVVSNNAQKSSPESQITSSVSDNVPVDLKHLEEEKNQRSATLVYPDGRIEKIPVKMGDESESCDSDNMGKVVKEENIKSYIVYRKKNGTNEPKEKKTYQCKLCEKVYRHKDTLKEHMYSHNGNFPFSCSVCDKKFAKRKPFQTHLNSHLEIKPYICEVCGRQFASNGLLKTHGEIHFNKKTHACKICDKKFLRQKYLAKHIRFHRKEKKFMCEECGKSFFTGEHLKRHTVIHSGVKPYRCELCPYECNQAGNLKIHMKVHRRM